MEVCFNKASTAYTDNNKATLHNETVHFMNTFFPLILGGIVQ